MTTQSTFSHPYAFPKRGMISFPPSQTEKNVRHNDDAALFYTIKVNGDDHPKSTMKAPFYLPIILYSIYIIHYITSEDIWKKASFYSYTKLSVGFRRRE